MLKLNNISSPKGAVKKNKRLGRGPGSGRGTQAGKGHKGQKARAGGGVRIGFEGGNMPLYMRLPKTRKFTNALFKKEYVVVDLGNINNKFLEGESVTSETLASKGLIACGKRSMKVKILATKKLLDKKLIFSNSLKYSESAKQVISSSGGQFN
jgi:large subunit ribosomal protein L15